MATSVPPAAPPLAPPSGGPPPLPGAKPATAKGGAAGVTLSKPRVAMPDALKADGWRVIEATDMNGIRAIPSDDMFKHIGVQGQERYQEPEEWFRYFWKEAVNMSDPPKFAALAPYFAHCLWIKGKHPVSKVQLRPIAPMEACLTDAEIKDFLRRILEIGFDSVPGSGDEGTASAAYGKLREYVTKATFEMAWRADTRDLDTIRKQGYLSKAAVASVAASMNLDKPWHPFSDPSINSRIWLRKGQTDNCLMTVVSVAERFQISLAYPKIGLTDALKKVVNNTAIFDGKRVKPSAAGVGSPYIGSVQFPGEAPVPRMITFSHVYLLVLDSWVYETGKWQASQGKERYPERAVKSVQPSNVIGKITFLRIHHGPSDEDGFTAFPIRAESSFVGQDAFTAAFGEKKFGMYFQQALAKYREALYSAPLALRWETTGIGSAPEPLKNDKGQPAKPIKATIGGKEYALG